MALRRIGLLGGTFDPIHVGHLALARAACTALRLDEMRLLPTGRSWQKAGAGATNDQRLAMARLAIAEAPGWSVDDREMRRSGATYTVDTLRELRAQPSPDSALVLVLGSDQLHNLATWHCYQNLLSYAHIAATQRGLQRLADFPPEVEALLLEHGRDALPDDQAAGTVVFFRMPPVPVSATALRTAFARGERPVELLPPPVLDYIERHHLYRTRAT